MKASKFTEAQIAFVQKQTKDRDAGGGRVPQGGDIGRNSLQPAQAQRRSDAVRDEAAAADVDEAPSGSAVAVRIRIAQHHAQQHRLLTFVQKRLRAGPLAVAKVAYALGVETDVPVAQLSADPCRQFVPLRLGS